VPDTGVVREYWFNVENTTAVPNRVDMPVQLINGSFLGPTIIADWGDTVGALKLIPHYIGAIQLTNHSFTCQQCAEKQWHWSLLPWHSPELD